MAEERFGDPSLTLEARAAIQRYLLKFAVPLGTLCLFIGTGLGSVLQGWIFKSSIDQLIDASKATGEAAARVTAAEASVEATQKRIDEQLKEAVVRAPELLSRVQELSRQVTAMEHTLQTRIANTDPERLFTAFMQSPSGVGILEKALFGLRGHHIMDSGFVTATRATSTSAEATLASKGSSRIWANLGDSDPSAAPLHLSWSCKGDDYYFLVRSLEPGVPVPEKVTINWIAFY